MCVSDCPRGYLRYHTCDLYQIFVKGAYGGGGPPPATPQVKYLLRLGVKAGFSPLPVGIGNTVWSHMACEFPVVVKAKLTLTAIPCLLYLTLLYFFTSGLHSAGEVWYIRLPCFRFVSHWTGQSFLWCRLASGATKCSCGSLNPGSLNKLNHHACRYATAVYLWQPIFSDVSSYVSRHGLSRLGLDLVLTLRRLVLALSRTSIIPCLVVVQYHYCSICSPATLACVERAFSQCGFKHERGGVA